MAIPGVFDLTLPTLTALGDSESSYTNRLVTVLAPQFSLSEADLAKARADGRPLFRNRIQWARTWLKKAGLIEYPEPNWSKITPQGLQLLSCRPSRLGRDYFLLGARAADEPQDETHEYLEDELRRLIGPAVADNADWQAVRLLNGYGCDAPMTYRHVAEQLGRDPNDLLSLGRRCRTSGVPDAPLLDASLCMALAHAEQEPDELSLELALAGLTRDAFCLAGLAQAARRFGREAEWQSLVRYFRDNRKTSHRPRPFDSWFEIDVYLALVELGENVTPQEYIGKYKVDLLLPDYVPKVVIECDGERFHSGERASADRNREHVLQGKGYRIVRVGYRDFTEKYDNVMTGLVETLAMLRASKQLRLA